MLALVKEEARFGRPAAASSESVLFLRKPKKLPFSAKWFFIEAAGVSELLRGRGGSDTSDEGTENDA